MIIFDKKWLINGVQTFENEIFLEIFYINLDIIVKKKFKILKDFFGDFYDN
jgi:hypothetical protein